MCSVYKLVFCCLLRFSRRMENKANHYGGLQQQSSQLLVNRYECMSSQNDKYMICYAMPLEYYVIKRKKKISNTM